MTEVHDFTAAIETTHGPVVERHRAGPTIEMLRFEDGWIAARVVVRRWEGEMVIAPLSVEKHEQNWPLGGVPTLSPSLLWETTGNGAIRGHGFLREGVWEPCGDDQAVPLPESDGEAR